MIYCILPTLILHIGGDEIRVCNSLIKLFISSASLYFTHGNYFKSYSGYLFPFGEEQI
jgi:hypothetical protein